MVRRERHLRGFLARLSVGPGAVTGAPVAWDVNARGFQWQALLSESRRPAMLTAVARNGWFLAARQIPYGPRLCYDESKRYGESLLRAYRDETTSTSASRASSTGQLPDPDRRRARQSYVRPAGTNGRRCDRLSRRHADPEFLLYPPEAIWRPGGEPQRLGAVQVLHVHVGGVYLPSDGQPHKKIKLTGYSQAPRSVIR